MRKFAAVFNRTMLGLLVLLQIFFYPAIGLAQEAPADTTTQSPDTTSSTTAPATDPAPAPTTDPAPSDSSQSSTTSTAPATTAPTNPTSPPAPNIVAPTPPVTGPTAPSGDASGTYTYNPSTGLWENAYYTWNPVTHQTAPKTPQTYSFNPSTGMWDTTQWRFDAAAGKYVPNTVSVKSKPVAVTAGPNDPLIANTGPNSTNNIGVNNNNSGTFNLFYNSTISNTINSNAHSGNASILQNTNGGSALTGNSQDVVNVLNMLQSSWNPTVTFSADINGNVTGDLMLDPNQIINSGPNSQNGIATNDNNNLDINVQADGQIVNNINAGSQSGDATVSQNTTGGDAQSGDATTLVNLINMINSGIDSPNSFLGVININGNLDGDILLPQNLVATIDTTGPNSTNTVSQNGNTTTNVTAVDNKSITNNTDLAAASGQANVSGNTNAGDATSGSADTKINIYNLTGRQIIGDNAILVFVNVKGHWTGLILNAPAGQNTVLGTGPNSSNTINGTTNNNTNVNATANSSIVNNVTGTAQSGDASVTDNTNGGSAKTGNASVAANIFNLIGSKLSLNGWFGVLFINVLGSWNGSFGINTAAGNVLAKAAGAGGATSAGGGNPTVAFVVPNAAAFLGGQSGATNQSQTQQNVVASGNSSNNSTPKAPQTAPAQVTASQPLPKTSNDFVMWIPVVGFVAGIGLLVLEWLISLIQKVKVVWASGD
jgi:hypothetical protein